MPKRSISDEEIALIKAMLARGMKNRDIQFFFNRPQRAVNTGRISTIRSETYSNSAAIKAAHAAELDTFIARFANNAGSNQINAIGVSTAQSLTAAARALFTKGTDGRWHLSNGESQEHECKQEFDPKKLSPIVRAIAALANNSGGYIFFGISNKEFSVEGINAVFIETDIVQITDKVKAHLSPTPSITAKGTIEFDGKVVGFLRVEKHQDRPVVVYRDGDGLNEGEILFRYPGQSARIKFGDLRSMLDERDRRAQIALANATGRVAHVGTANALIIDTEKNVMDVNGRSILIDEALAKSINFIKEGEFDTKAGAPALKLVGEVSSLSSRAIREAIFQEDILDDFLHQRAVERPLEYIRATLAQSKLWLPIFYFAQMSKLPNEKIAADIRELKISQKRKKKILMDRLEGKRSALTKAVTQSSRRIAADLAKGELIPPSSAEEVSAFAYALTALTGTTLPLQTLLAALITSKELAEVADNANALGAVYKAACRVDEMFFNK
jgi:Putative DNA-binding domain